MRAMVASGILGAADARTVRCLLGDYAQILYISSYPELSETKNNWKTLLPSDHLILEFVNFQTHFHNTLNSFLSSRHCDRECEIKLSKLSLSCNKILEKRGLICN